VGSPASLDLESHHFRVFYAAFVVLTGASASVVALPGLPLIPLIYSSQVVNAVMLPLHVVALLLLSRDASVMGSARSGTPALIAGWASIALIVGCIAALAWSWLA
jgi:Mn2+/Fe2+ NRAMP family transporter